MNHAPLAVAPPLFDLPYDADIQRTCDLLAETLRKDPVDQRARMFLFQILCVADDRERARAQLDILASRSSEARVFAAVYRQAIDALTMRDAALAGSGDAAVLAVEHGWASAFAASFSDTDPARRNAALAEAPDTPGNADDRRFDFLFDGDGRFSPSIEVIVGGCWGLIPFVAISTIETEGPVDLRDLVWLPAEIRLRDGTEFAALLPVTYPGTGDEADGSLRLARRTEWRERNGVVHGVGQRIWTTSAGEDVPILEFRRLRFDEAA